MTSAAISLRAASHETNNLWPFGRIGTWFRSARHVRALTNDLAPLSDEQRRDIGLGSVDIAAKVDAAMYRIEIGRLGRIPR